MRFGDKLIVNDFSATIPRATRSAHDRPNGAGKTTLPAHPRRAAQPSSGHGAPGTWLEVAYFDQMRSVLDLDATLAGHHQPGSEGSKFAARRKHVMSYLNDCSRPSAPIAGAQCSPAASQPYAGAPVRCLPTMLVLDEPTNDLDIDTLELPRRAAAEPRRHGVPGPATTGASSTTW